MTKINEIGILLFVLSVSSTFTVRGEVGNLAIHDRQTPGRGNAWLLSLDSLCSTTKEDAFEGCDASEGIVDNIKSSNLTTSNNGVLFACEDYYDLCEHWARGGLCSTAQDFMHEECPMSCNVCLGNDKDGPRPTWYYGLGEDLGVPQELDSEDSNWARREAILWVIEEARFYLKEHEQQIYGTDLCTNQHSMCAFWALTGECENDEDYMVEFCAPVCGRCDDILEDEDGDDEEDDEDDFDCFEGLVDAWKPGDIENTFRKLTSEPFTSRYQVDVLSSPASTGGPWIITIDGAISQEEAQTLIDAGTDIGYDRSVTTKGNFHLDDGFRRPQVSQARTSSTAWCREDCMEDPQIYDVIERISNWVGIPSTNAEQLQFLKYSLGQRYDVHHDMIPDDVDAPQGPRVMTAYIYLSDVAAGGGTQFDKLGITVEPKQGRVLLWPSVLDSDLRRVDVRTSHAALPVEAGLKYGANAWYHLSDFKTTRANGC